MWTRQLSMKIFRIAETDFLFQNNIGAYNSSFEENMNNEVEKCLLEGLMVGIGIIWLNQLNTAKRLFVSLTQSNIWT